MPPPPEAEESDDPDVLTEATLVKEQKDNAYKVFLGICLQLRVYSSIPWSNTRPILRISIDIDRHKEISVCRTKVGIGLCCTFMFEIKLQDPNVWLQDPNVAVHVQGLVKTYPGSSKCVGCKIKSLKPFHAIQVCLYCRCKPSWKL